MNVSDSLEEPGRDSFTQGSRKGKVKHIRLTGPSWTSRLILLIPP